MRHSRNPARSDVLPAARLASPQVFPKDTIFEQDPLVILNGILPLYLDGQILRNQQGELEDCEIEDAAA